MVKTLKFWANGGQIGGQFNILKYQTYINQWFTDKKRAHEGGVVGWGNLSCDRVTFAINDFDVNESQINWSRFIIVNIKMMSESNISRISYICLQLSVYNCIYLTMITENGWFT